MNATTPIAVAATGVCKTFDGVAVLDQVDLSVAADTVLAPTGAGKATTVRIGRVIHDLREVL